MNSDFPKFVQEGSGDGKMILKNPECYKKLPSKILFEDIHPGTIGNKINSASQLVTISYHYSAHDGKILRKTRFEDTLADFVKEFEFKTDITEAIMGMKLLGERRIIIPPEMNDSREYRIVNVLILSIKQEKAKKKTEQVVNEEEEETKIPKVESKEDNNAGYSITNIGAFAVTAVGSAPIFLQIIREIKSTISNSPLMLKDNETPPSKPPLDEQITYAPRNMPQPQPQPKPKQWAGVGPVKYKVIDEGEGEAISRYQQGCFEYKEADSSEATPFQGSPTGLALKLGPGFEEDMLEAIVGMKLNGRRIIFIPAGVSDFGEDSFLDLKLTAIRDLNPRSRI